MTPASLAVVVDNTDSAETVKQDALTWPQRAEALRIVDSETYTAASEMLKGIKSLRNRIAEVFDKHVNAAWKAHKALVAEKSAAEAPLTLAEGVIKRGLIDYSEAQERLRRAEEKRLSELARQAEEDRRMAEAAALEAEALATDDIEMLATAQEIIAAPVVAPVVSLPKATPTVSGISYRDSYVVTSINLPALVKAAALDANLLAYLQPNESAIGAVVRSTKGAMTIPGVTTDVKRIASASGR